MGPPAFAAGLTDATGESGTPLSATTVPLDALPEQLDGTDCLLIDRRTAGESWRATLERVADARPRVPVVVLIDDDAASTVAAAVEAGVADWLPRSLCETHPDTVADRIDGLAGRARPSRSDDPVERFDRAAATHDPDTGRLRTANGALVDLLGYDTARLREEGLDDLVASDSGIEPVAAEAGATWEPTVHEWQVETADGDRRWLATDVWPGNDGDGPCIFAVSRDVTERKRRERRFRLVAENVDAIIYVANEDFSEVQYLNPAYEDIWGRPVEEVYEDATAFVDAIDARDREAFEEEFARMREDIARGEAADSYEFEFRIRRPDGERRWISAAGYPVETAAGEGWYVGIASDITERRELERTYRELFNKSSAAITLHDPETKDVVGVNDTMCDLLGYDRETLLDVGAVGISVADEGYTEQRGAEIIDRIMATGEPEEYEWVVEDANGDRHVLLVTGTPV
ncbi:MAG: PAS domain S-box protein, partial [Haloplanus sp.]